MPLLCVTRDTAACAVVAAILAAAAKLHGAASLISLPSCKHAPAGLYACGP